MRPCRSGACTRKRRSQRQNNNRQGVQTSRLVPLVLVSYVYSSLNLGIHRLLSGGPVRLAYRPCWGRNQMPADHAPNHRGCPLSATTYRSHMHRSCSGKLAPRASATAITRLLLRIVPINPRRARASILRDGQSHRYWARRPPPRNGVWLAPRDARPPS